MLRDEWRKRGEEEWGVRIRWKGLNEVRGRERQKLSGGEESGVRGGAVKCGEVREKGRGAGDGGGENGEGDGGWRGANGVRAAG
ncbi:UNVERIFIED_CONTAM: hypothetical protein DV099_10695, partial [Bifidobacterium longum]